MLECESCGETFSTQKKKNRHYHYECTICGDGESRFRTIEKLAEHWNENHE